jgi:DnaJ family protein C protein 13
MDYQLFFVRPPGRPTKNSTKLLRILEYGISLSTLSQGATPVGLEIAYEKITNIVVSREDKYEFAFDVDDVGGRGRQTFQFACDARSALLTALFNKLDDLNGIGEPLSGVGLFVWARQLVI